MTHKLAIVAALEREVAPLFRDDEWDTAVVRMGERKVCIRERDGVLVTWGGIGAAAARTAAEMLYKHAKGELDGYISAGYAGALTPELKVGDVMQPGQVVTPDGTDCAAHGRNASGGVLVSAPAVAGTAAKRDLAIRHSAKAVDMEAHAVADFARGRQLPCVVIKVISDEHDSDLPPVEQFIDANGRFKSSSFAVHMMVRPWHWRKVIRLGRDTSVASRALCEALREAIAANARGELYSHPLYNGTAGPTR
jgi:nucleoside phosphorylase